MNIKDMSQIAGILEISCGMFIYFNYALEIGGIVLMVLGFLTYVFGHIKLTNNEGKPNES